MTDKWEQWWKRWWWNYLQNLQHLLDRTDGYCRDCAQCDIWDQYICPKCYDKKDISADDDFL